MGRRVLRANRHSPLREELEGLVAELEEEEEALSVALELLEVTPSQMKNAGAWLAEKFGRMKLNGELIMYSPLSRVHELEFLRGASYIRRGLWETLGAARDVYPQLESLPIAKFTGRCGEHAAMLYEMHRWAVEQMFEDVERDEPPDTRPRQRP